MFIVRKQTYLLLVTVTHTGGIFTIAPDSSYILVRNRNTSKL